MILYEYYPLNTPGLSLEPFPPVNTKYGAPMGRVGSRTNPDAEFVTVCGPVLDDYDPTGKACANALIEYSHTGEIPWD